MPPPDEYDDACDHQGLVDTDERDEVQYDDRHQKQVDDTHPASQADAPLELVEDHLDERVVVDARRVARGRVGHDSVSPFVVRGRMATTWWSYSETVFHHSSTKYYTTFGRCYDLYDLCVHCPLRYF